MALTVRGQRTRYDNISVGSATGRERTIAGTSVSPVERIGGGLGASTSDGDDGHTNVAVGASASNQILERLVAGANFADENVDTTSNTTT